MNQQKKIILWAVPRSISTAFFRAMMNRSETKVFLEPFSTPYYFGPEKLSSRYSEERTEGESTFASVKEDLEQSFEGYSTVFMKDMSYYVVNKFQEDVMEHLPKGYLHTFLLRDPHKAIYSLYKMSQNKGLTGWDHFDASEAGFKELYTMFELVTKKMGQEAIVVDADDLLQHPERMLRLYCEKVGIEFEQSMIDWSDSTQNQEVFKEWMPWFEGVLTSNTFKPSATKPVSPVMMPDLPKHVQKTIDDNMVYYRKMHDVRIKPKFLFAH